jgi:hypothetical protein
MGGYFGFEKNYHNVKIVDISKQSINPLQVFDRGRLLRDNIKDFIN